MIDVVMPQMGESIVEGTLTRWMKKPGEHVERDEPLFEISTDKVDTEIPAPAGGVLAEVLVQEGATVAIHTIVARINEAGGAQDQPRAAEPLAESSPEARAPAAAATVAPPPRAAAQPGSQAPAMPEPAGPGAHPAVPAPQAAPPPAQAATATQEADLGPLSPIVRKMAREFNIDLRQIKGTGAGGRITKHDVEAYMAAQGARTVQQAGPPPGAGPYPAAPEAPPAAPARPPAAPSMPAQPQAAAAPPVARAEAARARIEPMSNMRQKIAEHMIFSKRTSAHVTTVHKADI
ncbi:MAG TPA: biotin/lipoyl-containing protein, partial [Bryobacteraceae bacterium]|nr:biotin/lipoyl-containing protein [Bryobacteraceae bacterium]